MILETSRLLLVPLTGPQLEMLAENLPALEAEPYIRYETEPLRGELRENRDNSWWPFEGPRWRNER